MIHLFVIEMLPIITMLAAAIRTLLNFFQGLDMNGMFDAGKIQFLLECQSTSLKKQLSEI